MAGPIFMENCYSSHARLSLKARFLNTGVKEGVLRSYFQVVSTRSESFGMDDVVAEVSRQNLRFAQTDHHVANPASQCPTGEGSILLTSVQIVCTKGKD